MGAGASENLEGLNGVGERSKAGTSGAIVMHGTSAPELWQLGLYALPHSFAEIFPSAVQSLATAVRFVIYSTFYMLSIPNSRLQKVSNVLSY